MVENQNFGQAIEALKQGKRVARQGWNGKGMFTTDKKILTGWLASQTDMLSEDWVILD